MNYDGRSARISAARWEDDVCRCADDAVAAEEPLELRINGESLTVTMRTPGDDSLLAAGFLLAEGIIRGRRDIRFMGHIAADGGAIVDVALAPSCPSVAALRSARNFAVNSACGMCGKTSLSVLYQCVPVAAPESLSVSTRTIYSLDSAMRAAQQTFHTTGGLHAAALFDLNGSFIALYEDVGRHNAVDKVVGSAILTDQLPLQNRILMVSGRTSYEIVQKAAAASIPIVCSISAPSSYAVRLAMASNITLVGFLRGRTMNVYSVPERIAP